MTDSLRDFHHKGSYVRVCLLTQYQPLEDVPRSLYFGLLFKKGKNKNN